MATFSVDKRTEVSLSKFLFHTLVLPHTTKWGGVKTFVLATRALCLASPASQVSQESPKRPFGVGLWADYASRTTAIPHLNAPVHGKPVPYGHEVPRWLFFSQIAGKGVQGKTQRRLLAFALVRLYASVFALLCARSRVKGKDCAKPAQEPYTLVRTSSIARVPETSLLLAPPRRT